MKIAFFHHTLKVGSGIDTVIYELADRLAKRGEDVTVFCFDSDYKNKRTSFEVVEVRSFVTSTTRRQMALSPFILDRFDFVRRKLEGYDIVNTQHYPANYIVRNIRGPSNLVTEWSAASPSMFSSFTEKAYIRWVTRANRIAAKKADLVIAPCEFVRRWVQDNYSIDPITIFLDGVNFQEFNRNKVSADPFFARYPELDGKKIVLFVGRITESKNIHSLITCFSSVKREVHDAVLVIAGNYKSYMGYYEKLIQLVHANRLEDSVVLPGIVDKEILPSYFAASQLYATCSLWEGFLRAEAFAFGKPILALNAGANSETIQNEKTGILVSQDDLSAFSREMKRLLINETFASTLGENGYDWARKNLDFDIVSDRFRSLCRSSKPVDIFAKNKNR
jgi:glycosyltransferase involved in cell wall biosynthesis